jgi:hypothetical protein
MFENILNLLGMLVPWSRRMRCALRELHECDREYEHHLRERFRHETYTADAMRDGTASRNIRARALADAEARIAALRGRRQVSKDVFEVGRS